MSLVPLLKAEGIYLQDNQRTLLSNVHLSVSEREIVTIIGPNGAGKTSLLNVLLGLRQPTQGRVLRTEKLLIGYMPQRLLLNPQLPLTVKKFLYLGLSSSSKNHNSTSSNMSRYKISFNIDNALDKTNITELKYTSIHDLSGGEMQRVLLSRAILRGPQLLVLDEPLQGVDVIAQSNLYQLISQLRDELHCGVLMVSHDLHIVMAATDHVICLNQHICCHGHPDKISTHPAYLEMFGHNSRANVAIYTHYHDHNHDSRGRIIGKNNTDYIQKHSKNKKKDIQ